MQIDLVITKYILDLCDLIANGKGRVIGLSETYR